MLNECWFSRDPHSPCPNHPYCHCTLEPLDYSFVLANVVARSNYGKFDPYLFNTTGIYSHNKENLSKEWCYTVTDAHWLQAKLNDSHEI